MLGTFVILYLFLGGVGAAVLGTTCAWSLLFFRTQSRTAEQTRAFAAVRRLLFRISLIVLVAAALCLLLDLGRPEKAFLLFTRPTPSYLTVGSFVLAGCLAVAGFLVVASATSDPRRPGPFIRSVEVFCLPLTLALMLYTGLYLAWLQAVPLWDNPFLPWLLAASSLSSGLSVVLVTAPFVLDWRLLAGWTGVLHRIHGWVLLLVALLFAGFLAAAAANPFALPSLAALVAPEAGGLWLWIGFVGAGVALPLAAEGFAARLPAQVTLMGAELLCVAGGLILRFCLVMSGSH